MGKSTTTNATAWPRVEVRIADDGTGTLDVAGVLTPLHAEHAPAARAAALAQLRDLADRLGRPVTATTHLPEGQFVIAVDTDGQVTETALPATSGPRRWFGARRASIPAPAPTLGAASAVLPADPMPEGAGEVSPDQDPAPSTSPTTPAEGLSVIGDRRHQAPEPVVDVAPEPEPVTVVIDGARVLESAGLPEASGREQPPLDPPTVDDPDQIVAGGASGRPWWRRRAVLLTVAVVAVAGLVTGAGVWVRDLSTAAALDRALAQSMAAVADLTEATRTLSAARDDAEQVLAEVGDQVSDPALVEDLSDLVALVPELLDSPIPDELAAGDVDDLRELTATVSTVLDATTDLTADLTAASTAVRESHETWDHEQAVTGLDASAADLQAALDGAGPVLEASAGRVDDAVRQQLATAITSAQQTQESAGGLDATSSTTDLLAGAEQLQTAAQTVRDAATAVSTAQATWEQAEAARVAAAQATTAAPTTGRGTSTGTGSSSSSPAAGSPATGTDQSGGSSQAPATSKSINPGAVSSSSATPGRLTVSATTVGVSGSVVVSVAGVSAQIGTGSGTFTYTFEGLPAGTHAWSVSADGMVANGSKATAF